MNNDLLPAVITFNYAPSQYMDVSWLDSLEFKDIASGLLQSEAGKAMVSGLILRHYQLQDKPFVDFDDPFRKMALQPKSSLVQLVFHAGLVANCKLLKKIIFRHHVKALEACIGKKAYTFAVKKAPLMCGRLPDLISFEISIDWSDPQFIKKHVFRSGMRLLGMVFSEEPESYKKRFLFNFPMASQDFFYSGCAEIEQDGIKSQAQAVFKKLIREFLP